jgi:integration host factor subunit beta
MAAFARLQAVENLEQERRITRQHLIVEISRICEVPLTEAEKILEAMLGAIVHALRSDDHVELRGFGTFITRRRRARMGRNPKTGEEVEVAQKRVARFRASRQLLGLINGTSSE